MTGHLQPDPEVVAAYQAVRQRVVDLVRTLPEEAGDTVVPHCPAWTVRELLAHLVGVPEDILAGRMEGVTTEAWTAAQDERHRGEPLALLADSFAAGTSAFDAVLPHIPSPVNSQLVMDATTHEHDLRHAVGRAGARDAASVTVALGWLLDRAERTAPGLAGELLASGVGGFDLLRSLTGRRAPDQMTALGLDAGRISALLAGTPLRAPADPVGD